MYKYNVTDETIINASKEAVFNGIIEVYDKEKNWWMPFLSSKLLKGKSSEEVGSVCRVCISSIAPIKFITQTTEVKKNEFLKVIYTKGAFVGEGLWEFKTVENKTLVRFTWNTNPGNILTKFASIFYPMAKAHSAVMHKGFDNLKKKLELE